MNPDWNDEPSRLHPLSCNVWTSNEPCSCSPDERDLDTPEAGSTAAALDRLCRDTGDAT